MAAGRAAKERTTNLNEHRTITSAAQIQLPAKNMSSSDSRPLYGAMVHACQVKLLLRRARAQETGFQRGECLARLLQGVERICTSLEWLTGGGPKAEVTPEISTLVSDLVSAGELQ
jgi:hypothetical protein